MKFKTWFPLLLAVCGMGIMFFVFLNQSSPYVTIKEARNITDRHLHLAGDVLPGTFFHNLSLKQLKFQLRDSAQEVTDVVYEGQMPANLASVTKVVAIGSFEGNIFKSHQLLIKCPSKYESTSASEKARFL